MVLVLIGQKTELHGPKRVAVLLGLMVVCHGERRQQSRRKRSGGVVRDGAQQRLNSSSQARPCSSCVRMLNDCFRVIQI